MRFTSRFFLAFARVLFVIAIPLAIISLNVRVLAFDPSFYEKGQLKFGAMQTIGLGPEQIRASSAALANYFRSTQDDLASELQRQGLSGSFFSERETIHLTDVREIIMRIVAVQQMALGYAVLYLATGLLYGRARFIRPLAKSLLWGVGLTIAVLVVFGTLSVTDFSSLFLTFHLVSFSNDLWLLDPRTDYLIRMFPSQFFFEASLTLAAYSAMQAAGTAVVGVGLLAIDKSRARQRA
ncbi:MAG: TIGR01906 family membrane protein [Chloroflexi bacterium]|nr:TIGR01906 family membrane protein [Chloroflexota bacterium]